MLAFALVFSCCGAVSAASIQTNQETDNSGIIQYQKDGAYVTKINSTGLNAIRDSALLHCGVRSETENVNNQVMRVLGYSDADISNMGNDEVNELVEDSADITTTSTYYHYNEDNNAIELVTREDYAAAEAALSGNDGSNTVNSGDGYFRINTTASYKYPQSTSDAVGWYTFSGTFTFIGKMPTYRLKDAASLYADDVMWSQTTSDYKSTMTYSYYDDTNENYTKTSTKAIGDYHLFDDGLYYTWKLPPDLNPADNPAQIVTDIQIYIRGKARVRLYTLEQGFNLYTRYEHVYNVVNLEPSYTWTVGDKPGVSAVPKLAQRVNTYASYCAIEYNPGIVG